MRRVGVFGWGVVAPRSPNIEAFARNLSAQDSWLAPFHGFGPDNFLVGVPDFRFADYHDWLNQRFPPSRVQQLERKLGAPTLFALGAFIQSLGQNSGLEEELKKLGLEAHVYVGTGLGDLATIYDISLEYHRAQLEWNRFWCHPERNRAFKNYLEGDRSVPGGESPPPNPDAVSREQRRAAEEAWEAFWMRHSPELREYLAELRSIEGMNVEGEVESAKAGVLRRKRARAIELKNKWKAPDPPWASVSSNLIWNIHNTPASQISMIGGIRGMTFAPVAACSTFGYCMRLGMDAIRHGSAKAVVIGATDPPPHPLSVGAFSSAHVLAADGGVSKPLTGLRGTHVSGGSVIWVLGDHEYMTKKGFKPLGPEPLAVGVSADADHIITPSVEGPTLAIRSALEACGLAPSAVGTWDLHATATPGDFLEVQTMRNLFPESVLITARKGTFGHGMSAGGGWELLAQYLCYERRKMFPTLLREGELNGEIKKLSGQFIFDRERELPPGAAGKLSMGIGGINACVLSTPWR